MSSLHDLDDDLEDFIAGDMAAVPADGVEVPDAEGADRALRRVARIEAELEHVHRLAEHRIAQINEWRAEREAVLNGRAELYRAALDGWMRATHADGGPRTQKLPSGTVSLRKSPDRIATLVDLPPERFARTKVEWDKTAAKKATEPGLPLPDADTEDATAYAAVDPATGEVIVGLVWLRPNEARVSIKAGESA